MATYEVMAEIKTYVRLYVEADSAYEARYLADELVQDGYKTEMDCDPAADAEVMEYLFKIKRPKLLNGGE
jgi:hypothetical protein